MEKPNKFSTKYFILNIFEDWDKKDEKIKLGIASAVSILVVLGYADQAKQISELSSLVLVAIGSLVGNKAIANLVQYIYKNYINRGV
jgi:hypothetical protein